MNYEWKRADPLRIAIEYFSRACNELNPEDKIIESCKGYEALFTEGKKVSGAISKHIATKCSNYLSEIYDKEQVYEIINDIYQVRNDIMHGRLPRARAHVIKNGKKSIEDVSPTMRDQIKSLIGRLLIVDDYLRDGLAMKYVLDLTSKKASAETLVMYNRKDSKFKPDVVGRYIEETEISFPYDILG